MLRPVPINKGLYSTLDKVELADPSFAYQFDNLILSQAGSNCDRPDLSSFCEIGAHKVVGLSFWNQYVVAVTNDRKIYKIDPTTGTETEITGASVLGGTSRPVFANDGDFLAIAGGGTPKTWSGTGNCADMAGSPPNTRFISYLDGYWILHLTDDQEFRLAGPTAVTRLTWTATDFFSAEILPDNVLAQAVLVRELYAFGAKSIQIFQNFGETAVPFRSTFFIDVGLGAQYSVVQADNTLFWLDNDRRFRKLEGRAPVIISSPFDTTIKDSSFDVSDCWGTRIDIDGFFLILWVFPGEEKAFCYDYLNKEWSKWYDWYDSNEDIIKIHSHVYVDGLSKHYVGHPTTGTVSQLTRAAKGSVTNAMMRVRMTGQYDHGSGVRKRSNYYLFHVKRGVGTAGGTEPVMTLQVNDDGKGWSNEVQISLGNPGCREDALKVTALRGTYRKRQLKWSFSEPYEFLMAKVEEDVDAVG